ncbi:hypothetical protein BDP27DRAFT_412915 [Rhodocollybia butyracea]|uniref:Uncharacterized protein n=1 Tax=Rhodocollybia butyracea TaxID=206335 RepID=A0A9P5Q1K8_9AGAR|nr:hypothetical protein BDP27DRAFT_412915 [Rhodocollybia butyracea]
MLPFGYKAVLLFFLLLVFFEKNAETVASAQPAVSSRCHLQISPPEGTGWPTNAELQSSSSPHVSLPSYNFGASMLDDGSPRNAVSSRRLQIPIPVDNGWSVNVEFQSSSSPHVSFPSYSFQASMLDKNLERYNRSGKVTFKYERVLSTARDRDSVDSAKAFTVFEPLGIELEVMHETHRSTAIYKLSLVQWNLFLSADQIPFELRNGQRWEIRAPGFDTFHKAMASELNPGNICFPYNLTGQHIGDRTALDGTSKFHTTDITKVKIPIIVPILTSLTFTAEPLYGGVYDSPFRDHNREYSWTHLTHLKLDRISIFPREFWAILSFCPRISSMIVHRPGEGSCGAHLLRSRGFAFACLDTLQLLDCKTPIHGFLCSAEVHLTVLSLVLQTEVTQDTIQTDHLGLRWETILKMKLSERSGAGFIEQCRRNLSAGSILEIISN